MSIKIQHSLGRKILVYFLLLIAEMTLLSCGGGNNNSSPAGNSNNASPASNTAVQTYLLGKTQFMASVVDIHGKPITNASVGSTAVTSKDGVAAGKATTSSSGWYKIQAAGYVTDYQKTTGDVNGVKMITASLTPVGSMAYFSVGKPVQLTSDTTANPSVSINIGASAFTADTVLELTALDPNTMGDTLAPVDTTATVYMRHAFAITARDSSGNIIQPDNGAAIQATIADNGDFGSAPSLFRFDPEAGKWLEETTSACTRVDSAHVSCTIAHFSDHAGAGTSPPASGSPSPEYAGRQLSDALRNLDGGSELCTDAVTTAARNYANAALDFAAASSPSEQIKMMLLAASSRYGLLSSCMSANDPDEQDFTDAVNQITDKLAEPYLQSADCPDAKMVEHLLLQATLLGASSASALEDVYDELMSRCNVIEGTIEYSILLPDDLGFPSTSSYLSMPRYDGAHYWTESHDIKLVLSIDLDSENPVSFKGTDKVKTSLPKVEYRKDTSSGTGCGFPVYESTSFLGKPDPGTFNVDLTGSFGSSIKDIRPETATPTTVITMDETLFVTGWKYDNNLLCVKDSDAISTATFWSAYGGQISEQFLFDQTAGGEPFMSSAGTQLSTLWQIINRGPTSTQPGTKAPGSYPVEFYRGNEILMDTINILGPSEAGPRVVMRWNLKHTDYTHGNWALFSSQN